MSIDVAIAGGINMIKRGAEKIIKQKDLTIEVQRMWNVKIKVTEIATATGTTSKSF
jgi:hypothetical protein